jgi:hypothetical protein
MDVSQTAGNRRATGVLVVDDASQSLHVEMHDFGVLQSADGWMSLTGRVKTTTGPAGEMSATVIVDRANPLGPDHGTAIVIDIDNGYRISGAVAPDSVKLSITPPRLQPPRAPLSPPR